MAALTLLRHRELDLPSSCFRTIDEEIAVTILKVGAHNFVTTASAAGLPSVWISSCDQDVGIAAVDPVDADPSALPSLVGLVRRTGRARTVATRSHWPAS